MAKKQKTKAPKAAPAPTAPKAPGKPKAASNVYTGMAFIAMVMLSVALGFVLVRSGQLFGSVGELFNLKASQPARAQRSAPAPAASPAENQ